MAALHTVRHARACKLLDKASFSDDVEVEDNWAPDDDEKELLRLLARFPVVIEDAASARRVHPVAQYARTLQTHSTVSIGPLPLWDLNLRVRDSDLLIQLETIRNALGLLGIEAPRPCNPPPSNEKVTVSL